MGLPFFIECPFSLIINANVGILILSITIESFPTFKPSLIKEDAINCIFPRLSTSLAKAFLASVFSLRSTFNWCSFLPLPDLPSFDINHPILLLRKEHDPIEDLYPPTDWVASYPPKRKSQTKKSENFWINFYINNMFMQNM